MKFTKMHGIGNCYLYFNCFEDPVLNPAELSVRLSDVHFGVGSDGIILIAVSYTHLRQVKERHCAQIIPL